MKPGSNTRTSETLSTKLIISHSHKYNGNHVAVTNNINWIKINPAKLIQFLLTLSVYPRTTIPAIYKKLKSRKYGKTKYGNGQIKFKITL